MSCSSVSNHGFVILLSRIDFLILSVIASFECRTNDLIFHELVNLKSVRGNSWYALMMILSFGSTISSVVAHSTLRAHAWDKGGNEGECWVASQECERGWRGMLSRRAGGRQAGGRADDHAQFFVRAALGC